MGGWNVTDEEIYERHSASVERFFINKVRKDDDVEDLMHQVFLRFFERQRTGAPCGEPIRFLIGIARNVLFEYWRAKDRSARHEDIGEHSLADLGCGIVTIMVRLQNQRIVLSALRRIRMDYQTVLELYYWERMSYEDIAASLNKPPATVGTWLSRGREELRKMILRMLEEPGSGLDDGEPPDRGPPSDDPSALDGWMADAKEATDRRVKPRREGKDEAAE